LIKHFFNYIVSFLFRTRFYQNKFLSQKTSINNYIIVFNDFKPIYQEGHNILYGDFLVNGRFIKFEEFSHKSDQNSALFHSYYIHSFEWLNHLNALGTVEGANVACKYLESWINVYEDKADKHWDIKYLSSRIFYWLLNNKLFLNNPNTVLKKKIINSLDLQIKYFLNIYDLSSKDNTININIAKAIVLIGLCNNDNALISKGLDILLFNLNNTILDDGGHVLRNPSTSLLYLQDLLNIFLLIQNNSKYNPNSLTSLRSYIDKISIFIKNIRHLDGALGIFNGSTENTKYKINILLSLSGISSSKPIEFLRNSGYLNFVSNNINAILDVGAQQPNYNSLLSMELSINKSKIITNCGPYEHIYNFNVDNSKSRLDHSCLILYINQNNILEFPLEKESFSYTRRTEDSWEIVIMTYSGLKSKYGITYYKTLYFSKTQASFILGEDMLVFDNNSLKIESAILKFNLNYLIKNIKLNKLNKLAVFNLQGEDYCFSSQDESITIGKSFYRGIEGQSFSGNSIQIPFNLKNKTVKLEWSLYLLRDIKKFNN
jgi:uncharacterized heparinase superfamily protein